MNVVKTGDGRFIEVQGTPKGRRSSGERSTTFSRLPIRGFRELVSLQRTIIGDIRA
jgi:ribonuclease PH